MAGIATGTLKASAFDHLELDPTKSESSGDEVDWTEAEETAIRRKIDRRIVPLVTVLYLFCFLDRAVSSFPPKEFPCLKGFLFLL
jgi:hypothetical protein